MDSDLPPTDTSRSTNPGPALQRSRVPRPRFGRAFVESLLEQLGAEPPPAPEPSEHRSKQQIVAAARSQIERWLREGHTLESIARRFSVLGLPLSRDGLRTCLRRARLRSHAARSTTRSASARERSSSPKQVAPLLHAESQHARVVSRVATPRQEGSRKEETSILSPEIPTSSPQCESLEKAAPMDVEASPTDLERSNAIPASSAVPPSMRPPESKATPNDERSMISVFQNATLSPRPAEMAVARVEGTCAEVTAAVDFDQMRVGNATPPAPDPIETSSGPRKEGAAGPASKSWASSLPVEASVNGSERISPAVDAPPRKLRAPLIIPPEKPLSAFRRIDPKESST